MAKEYRPSILICPYPYNYSGQKEREDTGPIQQDNVRGLFLHPTLTITPNRECLGIIDYEQWSRE